jgi:hypothetical protein
VRLANESFVFIWGMTARTIAAWHRSGAQAEVRDVAASRHRAGAANAYGEDPLGPAHRWFSGARSYFFHLATTSLRDFGQLCPLYSRVYVDNAASDTMVESSRRGPPNVLRPLEVSERLFDSQRRGRE